MGRTLRCAAAAAMLQAAAAMPMLREGAGIVTTTTLGPESLDVRVSKAMRDRGYDWVRISVVTQGNTSLPGDFFDYNSPFQRKWTGFTLQSTLRQVVNGNATFDLGGGNVINVRLPGEGMPVRGFFIADVCISSRDLECPFKDKFKIAERLVAVINTLAAKKEIDFWGILGDNFYEYRDPIARQLFQALTLEAKSIPFIAVPGNHDFWTCGGPIGMPQDQYGNGFMQYYGQDTLAALGNKSAPYDFSANPDNHEIAAFDNFLFMHQIGDVAFLGYSGAHHVKELKPYMEKFCKWMENTSTVNTAMLLGHWNEDNLGCENGLSAPKIWKVMKEMPGCKEKTLVYVDGHEHCNHVAEGDYGFTIGAAGMGGCGQFGFLMMESNPGFSGGPNVRADYFEIASLAGNTVADRWDGLYSCLQEGGYMGCRDTHASKWRSVPNGPTAAPPTPTWPPAQTTSTTAPPGPGTSTTMAPAPAPKDSNGVPLAVMGAIGAGVLAVAGIATILVRKQCMGRRDERELCQQLASN